MNDRTPRPDATGYQPDTNEPRPDTLFEHIRDERDYLRAKLDQALEEAARLRQLAAAERERADVLQREALGRIEALTTTVGDRPDRPDPTGTSSEAPESTETNETGRLSVLGWLRRLLSS